MLAVCARLLEKPYTLRTKWGLTSALYRVRVIIVNTPARYLRPYYFRNKKRNQRFSNGNDPRPCTTCGKRFYTRRSSSTYVSRTTDIETICAFYAPQWIRTGTITRAVRPTNDFSIKFCHQRPYFTLHVVSWKKIWIGRRLKTRSTNVLRRKARRIGTILSFVAYAKINAISECRRFPIYVQRILFALRSPT